jgi:hypothetical protein
LVFFHSTVAGRHLEGDAGRVVVGPEPHLAVGVDAIPDGADPDQGPDVERERGFDQSATAGSHGRTAVNCLTNRPCRVMFGAAAASLILILSDINMPEGES